MAVADAMWVREMRNAHATSMGRNLQKARTYSLGELIADGIVHGIGLATAIAIGTIILVFAALEAAPELPALALYVGTLLAVLVVSLAYNLVPVSPVKQVLARFDQAAIFLFIAGTYTPFLAALGDAPISDPLAVAVWGASLVGVALKLIVPERFGRMAILLYLAIGWSGVLAFGTLASALPTATLWLLVSGGVVYSAGIIFHLWQRLKFQNVLWHCFVVAGATLHLVAILVMVLVN
jgi:hemolysin III